MIVRQEVFTMKIVKRQSGFLRQSTLLLFYIISIIRRNGYGENACFPSLYGSLMFWQGLAQASTGKDMR